MNRMLRWGICVVAVAGMTACAGRDGTSTDEAGDAVQGDDDADVATPGTADQAFIDMMVPHHQMALMMADDALEKADHEELRAKAAEILEAQQAEIDQLQGLRQQWFGSADTPEPAMMAPMPDNENYDLMWMREMMKHHEAAINTSTITLSADVMEEISDIARNVVDAQKAEQQELAGWIEEWFPDASPPDLGGE